MELNHRCLGVGQESLPLDHGTIFRRKPTTGAAVPGLEFTSGSSPPPVFKTGSSSGRITSVFNKFRGLESNQRSRRSERLILPLDDPAVMRRVFEARGEGLEPPQPGSKPGGLPLADPRSID